MAVASPQTNGGSVKKTVSININSSTASPQVSVQKVGVLREVISKVTATCRRDLGSSSLEILEDAKEMDVVLDFIAAERLKCYPHPGSKYDKVLRWAEFFVGQVNAFSVAVEEFVMYSKEAAQLVFGSCLLLLKLGEGHLELLEKLFGVYYKLGMSLSIFASHHDVLLKSSAAQLSCGKSYAALLQITANSTIYYSHKATSGSIRPKSGEFEDLFGRVIEWFYSERSVASIAMWASSIDTTSEDVETIYLFLQPQDRVTAALLSDRISSRHQRAEFTCEWAKKRLTDFARSKDDVILITGREYSGKSVLAGWIADRMRNVKGRLAHDVISFSIDSAIKEAATPLAAIKTLVLQMFDQQVGNQNFYNAIIAAVKASMTGKKLESVEDHLWSALDVSFADSHPLMIVADGVDSFGEVGSVKFLERLHKVSSAHQKVKTVALSRPLTKAAPKNIKTWTIDTEQTRVDIAHFVTEKLATTPMFRSMSGDHKKHIIETISTSASGSFTWADIVVEIIKTEKSYAAIQKSLASMPKTVKEVINRLVGTVDITARDSKMLLAWMLASQRPLLLIEIKHLLEVDFSSMTHAERFTDVEQDIRHACGGLLDITDGIVRFRSLAIRHQLEEMAANVTDFKNNDPKFPFHTKEANYDICLRILAYVKFVLDRHYPVGMEPITKTQITELFDEYALLEYACRYSWTHFKQSPMYQPNGQHKLTGGFKAAFPNSVTHVRVEGLVISQQYPAVEVVDLQKLALDVRQTVVKDSLVVLQTLINIAISKSYITTKETNFYWYQAFKLAQTTLTKENDITITCARHFIDSVTTFTQSTEIEETLQYIVTVQKTTHGASDETTITYMRRLAEYFVFIKDETRAATCYREIYEIMVSIHGHHYKETEEIFRRLKAVSKDDDLKDISRQHYNSVTENVSVTENGRITSMHDMVQQYEKENNVQKAEETMVNYWRDISEAARTTKDLKVQEQQVDATFEYVEFLRRHKRTEEATTILYGFYLELEKNMSFAQSKIGWIERIAGRMKDLGAISQARTAYSSLWSYYRSSGQQNTKEAREIAHLLTETTTTTVSSTTTIQSQEEMLYEILEISTTTSTTVDITMIKTTQQLITIYSRQEKHEEIIEVSRNLLQRLWPIVLTGQKDVRMPAEFITEAISIANQLAKSYFILHYVDESSQIYHSIFQAFRSQPKVYTSDLVTSARTLIDHYQSIYRHNDALTIYAALYDALVEVYGVSHHEVIEIAYEKADLELRQNRRTHAQASYEKIYTSLKGNSPVSHKDGIRAALALCTIYEKQQKWEQARSIYQVLWQTFLQKGQEYNLGVEFVTKIFDRYLYIIENKTTTDYKTLRGLASEYRDTCVKFYGAESEQTLTASMRLAELDEKDDSYKNEAIKIYETILDTHQKSKKIQAASIFTTIATAKKRLAHLYSSREITHDRAQNLYLEEYEEAKNKHGHSHAETLTWLALLVTCMKKRNNAESTKAATKALQDVSTHIILNEKDSHKLYESSRSVAHIYTGLNKAEATDFLNQLRRHVVYGDSNITQLKGKTTERRAYPFIIGFEESVRGLEGSGQFSVLMSELMTESLLTEAYMKSKKTNASFDTVFGYGIRLMTFLKSKDRKDATIVEGELLQTFKAKIVGSRQVDDGAIRQFFSIVVAEFGKDQQDVNVLTTVTESILRSFNENQFSRGYDLSVLSDAYMHHYDGFRSQIKIETTFKICLYLAGTGTKKCTDAKLNQSMMQLSKTLLTKVLQAARAIHLNLIALPIDELNTLVGLLGAQENYHDLEWVLHSLWSSRHTQTSWPPSTVVTIGRRLVECRFSMGHRDAALALCEDICYNLRRVWGPLDKTTLDMTVLLGEMYTAAGMHAKAMNVHEDVLAWITSDEIDLDTVPQDEEANIAALHIDLLKHAYARNNGFPPDKDASTYTELFQTLEGQIGKEPGWIQGVKIGSIQSVDKWVPMSKGFKEDHVGMWWGMSGASAWEFMSESEKKRTHVNAMRRLSGRLSGNWSSSYSNSSSNSVTQVDRNGASTNGSRSVSVSANGS